MKAVMIIECKFCSSTYKTIKPEHQSSCKHCGEPIRDLQNHKEPLQTIHPPEKQKKPKKIQNIFLIIMAFLMLGVFKGLAKQYFGMSKKRSSVQSIHYKVNNDSIRLGAKRCEKDVQGNADFQGIAPEMVSDFCLCSSKDILEKATADWVLTSDMTEKQVKETAKNLINNTREKFGPEIWRNCYENTIGKKTLDEQVVSKQIPVEYEDAESVFEKFSPNVIYVEGKFNNSGTGFLISPGIVLTNRHVVFGSNKAEFTWNAPKKIIMEDGETVTSFKRMACSKRIDVCMISIETKNQNLKQISFTDRAIKPGEEIFIIGFPSGIQNITAGIATSKTLEVPWLNIFEKEDHFAGFTTNAAISPGSSGSPVISKKGEFLGLAVGSLKNTQNLNFVIGSNEIFELFDDIGAHNEEAVMFLNPGFEEQLTVATKERFKEKLVAQSQVNIESKEERLIRRQKIIDKILNEGSEN